MHLNCEFASDSNNKMEQQSPENASRMQAPEDIATFIIEGRTSNANITAPELKRNQGLILYCVDNLTLTDYTCAVGDLI